MWASQHTSNVYSSFYSPWSIIVQEVSFYCATSGSNLSATYNFLVTTTSAHID